MNCRACRINRSLFFPAVSTSTPNASGVALYHIQGLAANGTRRSKMATRFFMQRDRDHCFKM